MSGKKIGLPFVCLIQRLVIGLLVTFTDRIFERVPWPIGQDTLSQSRSHVLGSFQSIDDPSLPPQDPSLLADPNIPSCFASASDIQIPFHHDAPASSDHDIPLISATVSSHVSGPIDPSVVIMGQLSILLEQQLI